ncbi:methyltransferase domain-containing protein [Paracoccus sp. S-4012]|uniref:class I SAM-dependent methyltransferase n=1 Tax=Paracoccus sp. S-4012 TaxID=2665648 RepID=UPI0012B01CC7|nr:class I SAM-dependent methyltransferase [Paracoccus sp. S-4012]MRX51426.1 methyltransferase domain-containing protein [Paracoccus sp. S-4012]
MPPSARHDAWQAGDSYEAYMGRWSRPIAARFLDWLGLPGGLDWLDLGCGTGALTQAILRQSDPAGVLAIDPSEGFIATARRALDDPRVEFRLGDAAALATLPEASRDAAVAGLSLNFIPDRVAALREMRRIVQPGGTVAFYVWDYPGGGMGFMRAFWDAAAALDPAARDLTENRRFPFCTREGLAALARDAGLEPEVIAMESPSVFRNFDDFWHPFTLGAGPAPGYCMSLSPDARERLRARLSETLPRQADGSIALGTRAWAVRARV